jgi:F-type H+-transporting ATPase subunit b
LLASQTFLFGLDPQLIFDVLLMAIAIFVLFLVASKMLFNPARALLKDRQDRIAKDISDAKEASESAAAMKAEYESKLKNIEKEAEAILSEARQKALKNEQRIVDEAKDEARRIVKHAQDEALLEQKRAMDDVKKEIVTVAGLMAQKVVSASIDTEIQESLVEETLKEMGDSTWLS